MVYLSLLCSLKFWLFVDFSVLSLSARLVQYWWLAMSMLYLLHLLLLHALWIKCDVIILLLSQMLLKHSLFLHHMESPAFVLILVWLQFSLCSIIAICVLWSWRASSIDLVSSSNISRVFHKAWVGVTCNYEMSLIFQCVKATVFEIPLLSKFSVSFLWIRYWSSIINHRLDSNKIICKDLVHVFLSEILIVSQSITYASLWVKFLGFYRVAI